MKLDLHVHTDHSFDCETNIDQLTKNARMAGLSAIAICDHDTMSACGIAQKNSNGVSIIPGMEITTRGGTHLIGLFLKDEIVSREILDVIDEIHSQDGLVVLPHPFRSGSGLIFNREKQNMFTGEKMVKIMSGIDLIESINYRSTPECLVDTDRFAAFHPDKPQIAGSDAHFPDEVGKAYVDLEEVKSNSLNNIRKALLTSPRTIRYEAFSVEGGWESRTAIIVGNKNSLIVKTRSAITKSIKTIYRKSKRVLEGNQKKGAKEKVG